MDQIFIYFKINNRKYMILYLVFELLSLLKENNYLFREAQSKSFYFNKRLEKNYYTYNIFIPYLFKNYLCEFLELKVNFFLKKNIELFFLCSHIFFLITSELLINKLIYFAFFFPHKNKCF